MRIIQETRKTAVFDQKDLKEILLKHLLGNGQPCINESTVEVELCLREGGEILLSWREL